MRAIHSLCSLGKERQEQKSEKANSQPCLFLLLFLSKSNALPFSLFSSLTRFFFLSLSYLFSFSFSASIFSPSLFSTIFLFFTLYHSFSLLSLYLSSLIRFLGFLLNLFCSEFHKVNNLQLFIKALA